MNRYKQCCYFMLTSLIVLTSTAVAAASARPAAAAPKIIQTRFVHGTTVHGEMPHHLNQALHDLNKLVIHETKGEIALEIITGRADGVEEGSLPRLVNEGEKFQAAVIASLALPEVQGSKLFEIPYLFKNREQAERYPTSKLAEVFSEQIEKQYDVKVLGHLLVSYTGGIAATDKMIKLPQDFSGRYINQGLEAFEPMWVGVKPKLLYNLPFSKIMRGGLNKEASLDTTIGVFQANLLQRLYTKFKHVTVAPGFYTIFRSLMINRDIWESFSNSQKAGVLRAVRAAEHIAFENERATTIYHAALNNALGVEVHFQTEQERQAWQAEFSGKVRDSIVANSQNPALLRKYLKMIEAI